MRLTHPKGIKGEGIACQYLIENQWTIIERNWHCKLGEIDIIASKQDFLVFFEVKLRSSNQFGGVFMSISPLKIKKISNAVEYYLLKHPTTKTIRVDALLIQEREPLSIHHLTNIVDSWE